MPAASIVVPILISIGGVALFWGAIWSMRAAVRSDRERGLNPPPVDRVVRPTPTPPPPRSKQEIWQAFASAKTRFDLEMARHDERLRTQDTRIPADTALDVLFNEVADHAARIRALEEAAEQKKSDPC